MTEIRARLTVSIEEALRIESAARRHDQTVDALLSDLVSQAAMRWLPPPGPGGPRHRGPRETQSQKRARLRAESPDGMSPYTREIQTIRPTKETRA